MRNLLGACASLLVLTAPLHAQDDYPNKPIKLVAGFAAGGGTDLVSRVLAEALSARLGQPVVVENQPGASGAIAAGNLARAEPDGYTLLTISSSSLTAAELLADKPFDMFTELRAVSLVQRSPLHLLVNAQFEAQDLPSLVELVKANPGKYSYAHAGAGGAGDLMARVASKVIGLDMVSVPYAGDGQSAPDVASGVVPIWASGLSGSKGMWEAGRVTMIATSSSERAPYAPDVPTFKEMGYDIDYYFWNAVVAPAGTPDAIVNKLNEALADAFKDEAFLQKLRESGGVLPEHMGPEDTTAFMKKYMDDLKDILVEVKATM